MRSGHRIEIGRTAGLRAWVLHDDTADLHATWVPGASMLGSSLVHHGEELLWRGAGAGAYARERKFMGIPFLHPWANRLERFGYRAGGHEVVLDPSSPLLLLDDNGLPIHGVLNASRRWSVREASADVEHARLVAILNFERTELLDAFRSAIGSRWRSRWAVVLCRCSPPSSRPAISRFRSRSGFTPTFGSRACHGRDRRCRFRCVGACSSIGIRYQLVPPSRCSA